MTKTIADLKISFVIENYISTVDYLYEFTKENRQLINLEIKSGTYTFYVIYTYQGLEKSDTINMLVENKIPLYHLEL